MFDSETLHALQYQGRRMTQALHGSTPPDRREAGLIQKRVDDILDRRPKVFAVASDGEIIYDNATPMVLSQGVSMIVNNTGTPEAVVSHDLRNRRDPV